MIKTNGLVGPAAAAIFVLNLLLYTWMVYLTAKSAAHVGAWPFG